MVGARFVGLWHNKNHDSPPSSPRPTRSLRARRRLSFSANDGQPKRNSEHPLQKERKHHLSEFQRLNLIEEYISINRDCSQTENLVFMFRFRSSFANMGVTCKN
jgi:hypothetical protein